VLELKRQRDRLERYRTQMETVMAKETDVARELLKKGLKKRALLALQKKKYQTSLVDKADAQLLNIGQMCNSIEFAIVEQNVFNALKVGNETLQLINSQMSLDDVQKLMDDSAEAIAYQNQIGDILSEELNPMDEEDIEKEFDALQQVDIVKQQIPLQIQKDSVSQKKPQNIQVEKQEVEEQEVEKQETKPKKKGSQKQVVILEA